jgi:hypothetical protein
MNFKRSSWYATWICAALLAAATLAAASDADAARSLPNPCAMLTATQVSPFVGGTPVSRQLTGTLGSRTCTWSGPVQGFMQTQQTLQLTVSRITKKRFLATRPPKGDTKLSGLSTPAYGSDAGLTVWKDNALMEIDNGNLAASPSKALALARAALKQL